MDHPDPMALGAERKCARCNERIICLSNGVPPLPLRRARGDAARSADPAPSRQPVRHCHNRVA